MKIDKNILKQLILEAYNNILSEQEQTQTTNKELFKQNAIKHLRMLKLLKSTVDRVGVSGEVKTMIDQFKKSNTSTFLEQVLGVKNTITVRTDAVFEDPMKLVVDVIDEVIKEATANARRKLQEVIAEAPKEGNLPDLTKDFARLEKHKAKMKKKIGPPKPNLE